MNRSNPPDDLCSRLQSRLSGWKMLPEVAVKALALARDPKCSIKEFSTVIERDPKLAIEILRIANSAYYAGRCEIISLKQAALRLGFAHCRNVILAASLGSALQKLTLAESWMQLALWRHAVLTGILSMELNRHFRLGFIGEELTAGLIHDVGRSLLGIVSPNEFAAADPLDFKQSDDRLQREREILQTDHCEMGAWFLVQNNLPEALVAVVHLHHTPALADEDKKLVALTAVADHIADYLQREESSDGYEPEANAAMEVLFTGNQQEVFCRDIQSIMNIAQREANSSNWTFGRT